jgi:hypothetical protein
MSILLSFLKWDLFDYNQDFVKESVSVRIPRRDPGVDDF